MDPSDVAVEYYNQPLKFEAASPAVTPSNQQQQQSVIMVNSSSPERPAALIQSFAGHMVLACCTFWCCGAVFGLVAFILAVTAQNYSTSASSGDRVAARILAKVSFWVSIVGIIVGTITIIIAVTIAAVGIKKAACPHTINDRCYMFKEYMLYAEACELKNGSYYDSVNHYCYY